MGEVPLSKKQDWDAVVDTMERKNLKLAVKNFGPIREGEVEFKPLTVFIGPNNSGKSYMATLLYAMTQALNGKMRPAHGPFTPGLRSENDEQALSEWAHIIFDRLDEPDESLTRKICEIVQDCFDSGVARLEGDIQEALLGYLGIRDPSDLIYQGYKRPEKFSINLFGQDSGEELVSIGRNIFSLDSEIRAKKSFPSPLTWKR